MTAEDSDTPHTPDEWQRYFEANHIMPIGSMDALIESLRPAPMSGSLAPHRMAEKYMTVADNCHMAGAQAGAEAAWTIAARWEMESFTLIPVEKAKTRGIIAISAVALAKRGGSLATARQYAVKCEQQGIPEWASETLHEILDGSSE